MNKEYLKLLNKTTDIDLLQKIISQMIIDTNCHNCKVDCFSHTNCEHAILKYYIKKAKE